MTLKAREVLKDCEVLVEELGGIPRTENENRAWMLKWAAVVAKLRSVGHVLFNVDKTTPEAAKAIDDAWKELKESKPEPKIFWEFIEFERNKVLKEYEFGPRYNLTLRPGSAWLNLETGETGNYPSGPTTYDHFMHYGAFEGKDPIDLCCEAIVFWRKYLDDVEQRQGN